ncbi:uncharacterized protein TM35_000024990 [Trypanosoma theileri]|uniref:Uncharacterized protein n=1 Tax=Trypanosoma theileri TaxID=67003 RepID=A0A1X0P969_9TRYP|nr:uncharacterized protein TM35_000024990 [Trypanosoma theileri]ORC93173.1 hypothetical protein TM35_000024990 [Trypanosoma theileri]
MTYAGRDKWRSPDEKHPDKLPWDLSKLDSVLQQATAAKVKIEKQLWCARVVLRCVNEVKAKGGSVLPQSRQLVFTLQYLLTQAEPTTSGAKLRQHIFSIYLRLLGEEEGLDELLLMDVNTVNALVCALYDKTHNELNEVAVLLARRISELSHVCSILVFEETLFEALQDLLEDRQVPSCLSVHVLYLFVNLCGHPKLHFKLARTRRIMFFAMDTLLHILNSGIVRRSSKKLYRLMHTGSPSHSVIDKTTPQNHSIHTKVSDTDIGFPKYIKRALESMFMALPCAMIIANLLSFPENRKLMLSTYPDVIAVLELCDIQEVSIQLREVAQRATNYLHEDEHVLEEVLVEHFESHKLGGSTVEDGD